MLVGFEGGGGGGHAKKIWLQKEGGSPKKYV